MKIINEFKEFISKGNVVDLAVGVIIGGAFGKIVTSLVEDLIMPPIGLLIGGVSFSDLKIQLKEAGVDAAGKVIPAVAINYGNFLQITFNFIIIAAAVFLMIKAINKLKREQKQQETKQTKANDKEEVKLLKEIRDLLKKQA